MTEILDLFGDPVPPNRGRRGRPQHVPTQENRNKVMMLLALGWGNGRIASALFITEPSLRKHYFSELKQRDIARDRLDASLAMKLWLQVEAGNVGAMKEFQKLLERNDLMTFGQQKHPQEEAEKPERLGKKEQAIRDAHTPDVGTTLGELMQRRQGTVRPN